MKTNQAYERDNQTNGLQFSPDYTDFIQAKRLIDVDSGFHVDINDLNPSLFDFQKAVTQWALRRGRAAIFGDTGTGKTAMQVVWADHVARHTNQPVLVFAPLAVSKQTRDEGRKFGVDVTLCRKHEDVKPGVNITNYEMLHHFVPDGFSGIVLDESSVLKSMYGKLRKRLTQFARGIPYRLACTATPAPNDHFEVINHAEYLGVMEEKEILAIFFIQDFNATSHKWRLKKHAQQDFWKWLASWARAFRMPSDLGFDDKGFHLPSLDTQHHITDSRPFANGMLFSVEANTLNEQREARRNSLYERVKICADMVNNSPDQWIVWCDLNDESDAAKKAIHGAVEVKGSDTSDHKERSMLDFAAGKIRVLVSKPSICGWGMNFQSCHNIAFLGLSHSFESYYQAIRRCWRFGQTDPVNVHIITSDSEGAVLTNIARKEQQADQMFSELLDHMKEFQTVATQREEAEYREDIVNGANGNWTMYLGDSVKTIDNIETESVGLIVYSPPFPGMYSYSNSPHDMGNTRNFEEMLDHYKFLVGKDKMLRVLKPGRICAVHLTQGIAFKHTDGYVGLKDFRGRVIQIMEDAGWIYYGEVCIEKNPQLRALRTKDQGLLFKTLATDSSKSRMAMADYILQFRKPGDNPEPIRAGRADHIKGASGGWISNLEWIEWASPVWLMYSDKNPDGIRESDVLNVSCARDDKDEKHLCPLQLGTIERVIKLWSNPGDLVYSPFAGIGSEGYKALELKRRFVGGELKPSYFDVACKNLASVADSDSQIGLFDSGGHHEE